MAATSSISSSDPPPREGIAPHQHPPTHAGVPWAFLLAIAIVGVVELCLHLMPRESLIAYGSDLSQYTAVREYIAERGPAEVALVGSSQMREGVAMPRLIERLSAAAGRPVTAANYATRGARVDGFEAVVDELLAWPRKPSVIVVGLSVRDLRDKPDLPRLAVFYGLRDWAREYRRTGWHATTVLPQVVRNTLFGQVYMLRYREQIGLAIKSVVGRGLGIEAMQLAVEPNPILGESTIQHEGSRGTTSLSTAGLPARRVRQIIARAVEGYDWKSPAKPRSVMTSRLRGMAKKLSQSGVRVIFVEMPLQSIWRHEVERARFVAPFEAAVSKSIEGTTIDYWPVARQPVRVADEEFSDLQHHNRIGAEKFSDWLADEIATKLAESSTTMPTTQRIKSR